jgi:hypothetical protein
MRLVFINHRGNSLADGAKAVFGHKLAGKAMGLRNYH